MIKTKDESLNYQENERLLRNKFFKDRILNRIFYKIDTGLINKNSYEISFLAFIYTLSGITAIDIPAVPKIVFEAKNAINDAIAKAEELGLEIERHPLLISSSQSSLFCNNSEDIFKSQLEQLLDSGIEAFELHIDTIDQNLIQKQINIIKNYLPNHLISLSLSRKKLSNANMIELIKSAYQKINKELIIEINEFSKTDKESFHRILQTISTADIINKQLKLKEVKFRKLPIILSGGDKSSTSSIAEQCGVPFNGITLEPDNIEFHEYFRKGYSKLTDKEINLILERDKNLTKKI